MPSPKIPKSGSDGALLKTWRPEGSTGKSAKLWLVIRRTAAVFIALGLVGSLAYLLISPLLRPKTYFAYLCADDIQPLVAPPIEFAYEDFAGFTNLENSLTPVKSGYSELLYRPMTSAEDLEKRLKAWGGEDYSIESKDAFILYISAHGIVREGKAYLMCSDFNPAANSEDPNQGLYEFSKLIDELEELPASTKLLLLDAGRCEYAPRLGIITNTFAETLRKELEAANPSSVWVLSANSPDETSHVSHAMRRSIFSYVTAAGLQGMADKDKNDEIHLRELYDFVRFNVSEWVKQAVGESEAQTPLLLGGNADVDPHLLDTSNLPEVETMSADADEVESEGFASSIVESLQDFGSGEVDEFGGTPLAEFWERYTDSGDNAPPSSTTVVPENTKQDDQAARDAERAKTEVDLIEEAWQLTKEHEDSPNSPLTYAPDLWRLHLDQLLWLESLQQSGVRLNPGWLLNQLSSLTQSLKNFGNSDKPVPKDPENVVDRIRLCVPTIPLDLKRAPTLALAEAIAAADPKQSLPPELQEFTKAYDSWLTTTQDLDSLNALTEESWDEKWSDFYEFQLLETFRSKPYLDNPEFSLKTIKSALEVRWLGERVAADLLWGQGWAAESTRRADQFRLEAERLLMDHAATGWKERCEKNLEQARRLYGVAQRELATARQAIRLQQKLLNQSRDFLRWSRYGSGDSNTGAPTSEQLEAMLKSLRSLQVALGNPAQGQLPNLPELERFQKGFAEALSRTVQNLTDKTYNKGDSDRIGDLLEIALLDSDQRSLCASARLEAEQDFAKNFAVKLPTSSVTEPPRNPKKQEFIDGQIKSEELFVESFYPVEKRFGPRAKLDGNALSQELSALPTKIRSTANANANLAEAGPRPQRIEQLRRVAASLNLVDALDSASESAIQLGEAGKSTLPQELYNAEWFDLMNKGRERFRRAQADASSGELQKLKAMARQYAVLAGTIPRQPRLPTEEQVPSLELEIVQSGVDLQTKDSAVVNLIVKSRDDMPVWIMAQYDENLIKASEDVSDNWRLLHEREVLQTFANSPPPAVAEYPYRPAPGNSLKVLELQAGQRQPLQVVVSRVGSNTGNANLVFRAIGPSEYIRKQIPIQLPGRSELQLTVVGGASARESLGGEIELYPNRVQELSLEVANTGDELKSLVASLYAPRKVPTVSIPTGSIKQAAADQILRTIGQRDPLARNAPLELPPGGTAEQIIFDLNSDENKALLGAKLKEGMKGISLPPGLLLDLIDQTTNDHIIRWLPFKVVRPRNFLTAQAEYDPGTKRLIITVRAGNPKMFPDGPVNVELEIDRAIFVSSGEDPIYQASLRPPTYEAELQVTLNGRWPTDTDYLPVRVSVDGYPRGFEFRVVPSTARVVLPAVRDLTDIRIVPPPNNEFAASRTVPAKIEVDVPEGFESDPKSMIKVGVDRERDGELEEDNEWIELPSDRDVELFALAPTKGGTFAVEPYVRDFERQLNTAGIGHQKVYIVGQIISDGKIDDSDYVEIVLDGDAPDIGIIALSPQGQSVIAEMVPSDLTGTKIVKGAFDMPGQPAKWVEGVEDQNGKWLVELDASKLVPGESYNVMIEATDDVNNVTSPPRTEVWIQEFTAAAQGADQAAGAGQAIPKQVKNRFTGKVTYGRNAIRDISVTLTGGGTAPLSAKISEGGFFDFGMVAPGTYALNARGLSGGNYQTMSEDITISGEPNQPLEREVKLK